MQTDDRHNQDEVRQVTTLLENQFTPLVLMPEDQPQQLTALLDWGTGCVHVNFDQNTMTVLKDTKPDFTVYVNNYQTLLDLLANQTPLMEAVMEGKLRSDGYIIWTFRLMMALQR